MTAVTDRATFQIVGDLRRHDHSRGSCLLTHEQHIEAADRLDRLEWSNHHAADLLAGWHAIEERRDAMRPRCPLGCDAGVFHEERAHSGGDVADLITGFCDCDNGLVPWEQIVAEYHNAQAMRSAIDRVARYVTSAGESEPDYTVFLEDVMRSAAKP